jgi:hypothetical protein
VNAFRASLIFAVLLLLFAAVACGGKGTLPGSGTGFGGPGPWGPGNAVYGAADGIQEAPVIGISTDESQNLWVATNAALYLLKPGEKSFHRFDARDGLHLAGNPVTYCDSSFAGGDKACPITGAATAAGISEIEGGGSGEVFVGYSGDDEGNGDWSDPGRHSGKLDRVRLGSKGSNGSLAVVRFDFVSSTTAQFWHNRTVQRLLYDHFQHPHELYVGTNHGVDRLLPDKYRAPNQGEWFLNATQDWMSDHLHPQVCYHRACDASETGLMLGDWKGLALGPHAQHRASRSAQTATSGSAAAGPAAPSATRPRCTTGSIAPPTRSTRSRSATATSLRIAAPGASATSRCSWSRRRATWSRSRLSRSRPTAAPGSRAVRATAPTRRADWQFGMEKPFTIMTPSATSVWPRATCAT